MMDMVYEELRRLGGVRNGADFSRNWLGMEGSYWRGLRTKRRKPSAIVLATCAVRLLRAADGLSLTPAAERGAALRSLAQRCVEGILQLGAWR